MSSVSCVSCWTCMPVSSTWTSPPESARSSVGVENIRQLTTVTFRTLDGHFFFIACHWIILQYARLKGCATTVSAEHCRTRTISAFEFPPSKRRPPNGLDQHAAWSTPSPLVEARLVYHGLSDVPPQGSPSERLDAIEGCLWKETKRVVIVLQGVPSEPWSPQNLRALVKYLAALFCLPSRRRLSASKWLPSRCPTDAHEQEGDPRTHSWASVGHLLGSHFEDDSRLRDGRQNKAARFFTRAGEVLRGSGLRRHTLEDDDPSF